MTGKRKGNSIRSPHKPVVPTPKCRRSIRLSKLPHPKDSNTLSISCYNKYRSCSCCSYSASDELQTASLLSPRKRQYSLIKEGVNTNEKCQQNHFEVQRAVESTKQSKRVRRHRSASISPCKKKNDYSRPYSFSSLVSVLPSASSQSSFMFHNQTVPPKNRRRSVIGIGEPHKCRPVLSKIVRRASSCQHLLEGRELPVMHKSSVKVESRSHRSKLLKCRRFDNPTSPLSPRNNNLLAVSDNDSQIRLMDLLEQKNVLDWSDVFDTSDMKKLRKIGEGVYGEVYQSGGPVGDVIKIFPVEGQMNIMDGSRSQMTFHGVYPEIYVSKCLAELAGKCPDNLTAGFVHLKRSALVRGKLPEQFVREWNKYDEVHSSDNICLDYLPDDQLWMVLIYDYAGVALVTYQFANYGQLHSVLSQLCLSVAAAESELQFEHRDLHWGNVLIRPTPLRKLHFRVLGVDYNVLTCGVRATIIDFTVSRMATRDGSTVYVNLSENPDIFSTFDDEYQSEIYRMMRRLNRDNWSAFHPKSNLIWLHYLCDRLLYHVRVADTRSDETSFGELLTLEEDLRRIVNPPPGVVSSRAPALSTRQAVRRFLHKSLPASCKELDQRQSPTSLRYKKRRVLPLGCHGAVELVSRSFFFDSCRGIHHAIRRVQ